MGQLGELVCGATGGTGLAQAALGQLSRSIDDFSGRALGYLQASDSPDTVALGPFCARVILENSCAALVGRIDCFRMMYLSAFQAQPQYEAGRRAKSAFSWFGDVIPDEKGNPTLWSIDNEVPKISRALFSKHMDHVFWKPAIEQLLDLLPQHLQHAAPQELLELDADNFIEQTKGRSQQIYSTLSKSVHWEFFASTLMFDEAAAKDMIRDSLILAGTLGLISHFIPTAYASLSPTTAIDSYLLFRKDVP